MAVQWVANLCNSSDEKIEEIEVFDNENFESCHEESYEFDEDGTLTIAQPLIPTVVHPRPTIIPFVKPCSLKALNGSWYVQLTPKYPWVPLLTQIRGPMRIEAKPSKLRVSGDIYVKTLFFYRTIEPAIPQLISMEPELITAKPLIINKNWYPHFPFKEYSWYFRSTGVKYYNGELVFKFERHLWDRKTEEFKGSDKGWMKLKCSTSLITFVKLPSPTIKITGEAMVGGVTYNVTATKTSPYYRGCHVEVDVMKNRSWPASATSCEGTTKYTFTGTYRSGGLDFRAVLSDLAIPEDPSLTFTELHQLMSVHRDIPAIGHSWRVWLFVGSKMGGTYGIMFDDVAPYREGAAGFYDPTMPSYSYVEQSARGKKLGEVPLAFLRTLVHEAGHVFNLYHPKHDVHGVPKSTTIMNQTGDVMGFATTSNPYPCNATFGFNDHNTTSLIHSPDPQVAPGWKKFGWGHGSLWSGISEPIDAVGLNIEEPEAAGLRLELEMPKDVHRGEFFVTKVTLTNTSDTPQNVTSCLNLSEGDLKIRVKDLTGDTYDIGDIVVVCSDRRMITLKPGESKTGYIQLFYTNHGLTLNQPGRYVIQAELDIGDEIGSVVKSTPIEVVVRPSISKEERKIQNLSMDVGVGRSLALGDFGKDEKAREKLEIAMDKYGDTLTGAACAMVLANSYAREFRDVREGATVRDVDETKAKRALEIAMKARDAATAMSLATAVVSPRETDAPLLSMTKDAIEKAPAGTYVDVDKNEADRILSDHIA